jgi:Mg-chelatase subunit ChlI
MKVDGHRADIVILKTALAHAAFNHRSRITQEDILTAAELALPHRLKRQPFQDTTVQFQELSDRLEKIREDANQQDEQQTGSSEFDPADEKKKTTLRK